jgi:hypothetical protein
LIGCRLRGGKTGRLRLNPFHRISWTKRGAVAATEALDVAFNFVSMLRQAVARPDQPDRLGYHQVGQAR